MSNNLFKPFIITLAFLMSIAQGSHSLFGYSPPVQPRVPSSKAKVIKVIVPQTNFLWF